MPCKSTATDLSGKTALHYACELGDAKQVRHILKIDFRVVPDESMKDILRVKRYSFKKIDLTSMQTLDIQVDVNALDHDGVTPLAVKRSGEITQIA